MPDYKVIMELIPDKPNVTIFHSKVPLTTGYTQEHIYRNALTEEQLASVCPVGRLLISMDGVTQVVVEPYQAFVFKATMFQWSDLAPKIIEVIILWHYTQCLLAEAPPELEGQKVGQLSLDFRSSTEVKE